MYHTDMLKVVTIGDNILREKALPVEEFGPELKALADEMFETMKQDRGIGLAGPQIAVSKRMFVIDVPDDAPQVYINPDILETSQEIVSFEEGCLSIPGVFSDVIRPAAVTMQAQHLDGKAFTVKADGILARVIQHEYDHLNGVLFIDRIPSERRDQLMKTYYRKQKKKHKYL